MKEFIDSNIQLIELSAQVAKRILENNEHTPTLERDIEELYIGMSDIAKELEPCMPYVKEKNMSVAILCYHLLDWRKERDKSKVDNTFKMIE